ncbi:hypothetical protein M8J76_007675 [Diaphorina citri]|nr:hypothetical protein M8J76_000350 [Diaphorina citri]KAI5733102.1 hypothetical protein M8J76_007675 [Diaphorina citri]
MNSPLKLIHPVRYYKEYLKQKVRPDGRGLSSFRPISLNINSITTADGSAVIKIGKTSVICAIKAELTTPKPEAPKDGLVCVSVATSFMNQLVEESNLLNLESLCIQVDKLVWVLYCDIICLNHDGALLDACVPVLIAALKTMKLPAVTYDTTTEEISVDPNTRHGIPLNHHYTAITHAIFNETLLADPSSDEENICDGTVTIVCEEDKFHCIQKPGGVAISDQQIQQCIKNGLERSKSLKTLINTVCS